MNKKVALSVLSATVFASMAASAFAAPKSGLYIGGEVDKFYSFDTLFDATDATMTQFTSEIGSAGFSNLIYVDFDGKGASLQEIMDSTDFNSVKKDLTADKFEGVYSNIKADGTVDGTYDPRKDAIDTPSGDLKVESVSAINANEVKVEFSTELDKTSAETVTNYTINGNALIATKDKVTLNADKKSVTIKFDQTGAGVLENGGLAGKVDTAVDGLFNNNTAYTVGVTTGIKKADGTALEAAYSTGLYFADSVKPSVTSVTSKENGNVTITFSERLDVATTPGVVINGTAVTAGITVNADGTVTIAKGNLPAGLVSGTSYPIVVTGAKDLGATNTMNLYSGTFTYSVVNDAPAVKSVTVVDEDTFEIEFTEELSAALIDGGAAATDTLKVYKGDTRLDSTPTPVVAGDFSKFTVDVPATAFAAGEATSTLKVVLEGFKDANNNNGAKTEKTVTLNKDVTAPTVTKATYDAAADTITLDLSEAVDPQTEANLAAGLYIVGSNGVKYTVDTAAGAGTKVETTAAVLQGDKKIVLNNGGVLPAGTYTVYVSANTLADESLAANKNALTSASFTIGNGADTTKPTLDPAAPPVEGANGVFTVTFNEAVKGGSVAGSATDYRNYKLNGTVIPADSTLFLDTTKKVVTITLPEGTVKKDQTFLLTVNNVQDLAGNVILEDTKTIDLDDNENPELLSAKVNAAGELVLTFNEDVTAATMSVDFAAADFEVKVNGTVATLNAPADSSTKAVENTQLVITSSDTNFATGTITVSVKPDGTVPADAAANEVVTSTEPVTATR